MSKFFLIKEHNYEKIDGVFMGQDRSLILGSFDNYDIAIDKIKEYPQDANDVIYVVEVVAKCFGDLKIIKDDCGVAPTKICDECEWPEHEGKCGPESLQR